ncbi:MAG: FecR domain-containing protein [Alphaproteobacteria bacterium]
MISRSLAAILGLAMLLTVAPAQAAGPIGQIKEVSGQAHIESAAGQRPAALGGDVFEADTIVTGADGAVGITFMDDSRFSAGPNSRVALEAFAYDTTTQTGNFTSRVERGTLAVTSGRLAKSSPDAMKVVTRGSILGIRGTKILVRAVE